MPGTQPSKEVDEFACQQKCLRTLGCSHFSFWKAGKICHLQNRFALRREQRVGFVSGPFQCWSYLIPGQYAMISNTSYVPTRFRCMQTGVTWSPDMTTSSHFHGERDEVVFACQQKCRDTKDCAHFTVMFPSLCRLASHEAQPLPAEEAISGPPAPECDDSTFVFSPLGHTFMRKYESNKATSNSRSVFRVAMIGPAALLVAAAAVMMRRRRRSTSAQVAPLRVPLDLEESLQYCPVE